MESIIYVKLLDEGTLVHRPIRAIEVKSNIFKIVDEPPDDEVWEFTYNDLVQCSNTSLSADLRMVAIKKV